MEVPDLPEEPMIERHVPQSEPLRPVQAAPKTVAQMVQEAPGPNLDQIQLPAEAAKQQLVKGDGTPDFAAIFSQAGVPSVAFGADEALQVIASLPPELPMDVKRKTVGATLGAMGKAMGITTDTVVVDAGRKVAALSSFSDQITAQSQQYQQSLELQIAQLKAQIADCESKVLQTKEKLQRVVKL